jgi:hypothetical protein
MLLGKWRITQSDLWDKDYLDLVEPAYILFKKDGHGEVAFGALNAGLDLEYGKSIVFFNWAGFDEMDEVNGSGSAELNDDDTITIELAYHNGDEAEFTARRW